MMAFIKLKPGGNSDLNGITPLEISQRRIPTLKISELLLKVQVLIFWMHWGSTYWIFSSRLKIKVGDLVDLLEVPKSLSLILLLWIRIFSECYYKK